MFLRVTCTRYLTLQLSGGIPADRSIPIRALDADAVLGSETRYAPHGQYEPDQPDGQLGLPAPRFDDDGDRLAATG